MKKINQILSITVPTSTSTVKWYSYTYTIAYGGQNYNLQDVYAQGLNGSSILANGANGVVLARQNVAVNTISTIASIYGQKLLSTGLNAISPVLAWSPYELLFSNNTAVTNNSHLVTYRSLSTICFTYAKKASESSNYQNLSFVSNMVSIASTHTLAGYNNGVPYTKSTDTSTTAYADEFGSMDGACNAYSHSRNTYYSFIKSYVFYNHDRSASITQNVINPKYPGIVA